MKVFQASTITRALFEQALAFFPARPLGAAEAGEALAEHLGACWGVVDAASRDLIKVHGSLAVALWERLNGNESDRGADRGLSRSNGVESIGGSLAP